MENINAKVATRIRSFRESKGFSQDYVAAKLNVPQNTYSRLENGETKISLDRLFALAFILEESIYNILDLPAYQQFNECKQQTVNGHVTNNGSYPEELHPLIIALNAKDETIKSLRDQIELLTK